jgi:hypothetical protein
VFDKWQSLRCPHCGGSCITSEQRALLWQDIRIIDGELDYDAYDWDRMQELSERFLCEDCDHFSDDWRDFLAGGVNMPGRPSAGTGSAGDLPSR